MEFLNELDAPAPKGSVEIDLDDVPEVMAAAGTTGAADAAEAAADGAESSAGAEPVADAVAAPAEVGPDEASAPAAPEEAPVEAAAAPAEAPAQPAPSPRKPSLSPEQALAQRRLRAIVRIQTIRDSFRLLGYLGIEDSERKEVARMMMELDEAIAPNRAEGAPSPMKEPDKVLGRAKESLLEQLEREISPIEDKLLSLDDLVYKDDFRTRIRKGKHNPKVLARYGRLLASRRFPAGYRRDRFEWLATELLTRLDEQGRRAMVDQNRARAVLQHLVGGLPHKVNQAELEESVSYLRDALAKLETFKEPDGFFESGFFLDVHGYKVSMRDQLLNPDFLYLSAAINARLHNLLEEWIAAREELHDANRLTSAGSPREQIMGMLAEQEDAVDNIFGVKRQRPKRAKQTRSRGQVDEQAQQQQQKKKKKKGKKKAQKRSISIAFDRQFAVVALLGLLILGSVAFLLTQSGAVGGPAVKAVPRAEARKTSDVVIRALIYNPDSRDGHVTIWLHNGKWKSLSAREKQAEADKIAELVRNLGMQNGKAGPRPDTPDILIRDGLVVNVEGLD